MVKRKRNDMPYSIGAFQLIEPFHIVAVQLKTLTPEGTAMKNVMKLKIVLESSLCPDVNMWWPQTRKPSRAMATLENAMAR
jgi:hypothetical protein